MTTDLPRNWTTRFFTIFAGQALSLFGSALVQFALVWYLTQKTGSATVLATATLFAMLPQILLGPIAGTVVDRGNRRRIMIGADLFIAAFTLLLAFLFWTGRVQTWHIFLILAIRSVGGAFHFPAMSASTSLMVPPENLSRVAGANQMLFGLINIVAPPVGALLVAVLANEAILMIDLGTALLGVTPLLLFSIPQPVPQHAEGERPSFTQDLVAGFKYMVSWPGLLMLGLLATVLNFLLVPTSALAPLLVTRYFEKGALELGSLDSCFGIGMILGGVTLGVWGGFRKKIVTSLVGIICFSVALLLIAIAPSDHFWQMLAGTFGLGFMIPICNGPVQALFQTLVEPHMQGRVLSLVSSVAQAMSPVSLLIAGPLTDATSYQAWYWLAGILTLLVAVSSFFIPAIFNIEESHHKNAARGVEAANAPAQPQ